MTDKKLNFTMFTSIVPTLLSKSFSLTTDGVLKKTSSADMSEGKSELVSCRSLIEFNDHLSGMSGSQALCYGIAPGYLPPRPLWLRYTLPGEWVGQPVWWCISYRKRPIAEQQRRRLPARYGWCNYWGCTSRHSVKERRLRHIGPQSAHWVQTQLDSDTITRCPGNVGQTQRQGRAGF